MLRVVVLSCLLAFVISQSTDVTQCINSASGPLPLNVQIEGCVTAPCVLPQLQDVVANIIFRAPRTMRAMRTLANAYLSSVIPISIPYQLGENAITCDFLTNTYCPVLQDEVVQYTLRMFILSSFPEGTTATIEFRVVDTTVPETQTSVFCIRVPIRIVAPIDGRTGNATRIED